MTPEQTQNEEARALLYRSNQLQKSVAILSRSSALRGSSAQAAQNLENWEPLILANREKQNGTDQESAGGNPYR